MADPKKTKTKNSKSVLSEVLFKYMPYWPLFVVFILISLFAAWFYLRTTLPQYEASASIMLKDEKKGSGDGEAIASLDQLSGKKIVENELEVLQSRTLMTKVVENLHLYASFTQKGKVVARPAYTFSPVMIEAADPDKIRSMAKVEFSFDEKDSQVVVGAQHYPLNKFMNTPWGYIQFVPNPHFTTTTPNQLYFAMINPKDVAGGLLGSLRTTSSTKLSTVVDLKIRDEDPQRAEDVLNELITVYNKATIDDKNRLAANTSSFVEERLDSVQKELLAIEQKAQAYKSSKGAVDISTQGQLFLQNVSENDQKMADVNSQLVMLQEAQKYVESKDNGSSIVPSTLGVKDPTLITLLTKLSDQEMNYERLKKTTGEGNPMLTSIADQINKIKPAVLENIQNQVASLEANKKNLYATNGAYSSVLQSMPQKEKELIDINREQAIKSGIYSFLLQKKEESALAVVNNIADSRIVDRAQASLTPVSPKSKLIYIVALVFAFIVPAGFVSAKELLNRKILFRSEIESLTTAPIIGEVIFENSKDPLVIEQGKRTFIAEQFRRIRTSLGYLGGNTGKKRILVTSSLSGEGKSFVALNLAQSLALTNKKVILLELDLANPSLSKKLNVNYEQGVSSYLWGECEPEEVIKRTVANSNLFFLPAGPLPENPSELLMSDRLKELLTYLDDIFDVIVIDSAPASLLSDAYVLSPMCDATLYVVKHRFTPKIYLERLDDENEMNHLKNMAIVFNSIRSRGFTKNGYGYGYGYGYIHNSNGKKKKV